MDTDSLVPVIPVLMCPSCWRIQSGQDDWDIAPDRWVDPTAFLARGAFGSNSYHFIDGYCDPCLDEMLAHDEQVLMQASMERLNS